MRFILLLLNIFYINFLFSGTYKVEAIWILLFLEILNYLITELYRTFSLDGMWKDSLGDIGAIQAFGKVESFVR